MDEPLDGTLLLVEGDPGRREAILARLREAIPALGVEVAADDAALAAALQGGGYEAVLTAARLPWIDGLEVLRRVRGRDPFCPVLFLVAPGDEGLAEAAAPHSLTDYVLASPAGLRRLPLAVRGALLQGREARRRRDLEVLAELAATLGFTADYDELFSRLVAFVHRWIAYDLVAGLLVTEPVWKLWIYTNRPPGPGLEAQVEGFLLGMYRELSRQIPQADLQRLRRRGPGWDPEAPPIRRLGSLLRFPLWRPEADLQGVFLVGVEEEGAFLPQEARLLREVARQAFHAVGRLQAFLAAQEDRVEALLEHLPEGILLLDGSGRLALANPAARTLLPALGAVGIGEVLEGLGEVPREDLLAGTGVREIVLPNRRIFELQSRPLRAGPDVGGWVVVLREVTRERELEARSRRQERLAAVGRLAAGIAHDFNNLLTGILGFAELTAGHPDLPDDVRPHLHALTELGQKAAHLVRQVLDFSRQSVVQKGPLDLWAFLRECLPILRRMIPEDVEIRMEGRPGRYVVEADPVQMQQILINLATNARDAMPEGGELTFRLRRREDDEGAWVVLEVSDTGIGIPPENLPHIFEPFFTTKPPEVGTGLGLAQVYGIVQQHGGRIGVRSRVGEGTTFSLAFPALPEEAEVRIPGAETGIRRGQGEGILLVEDNVQVLEVARLLLERLGYRVWTARDGREALERYEAHREEVDLVLTDVVMPRLGGVSLARELLERDPDLPVLLMSGYPLGMAREVPEGIAGWIQKPLTLEILARAVAEALEGRRRG